VTGWGSGSSPVLAGDFVIVNASVERNSLVALNKSTGTEAWQFRGTRGCWNTPILVAPPGGKNELIISLPERILALDPATGEQLWHCQGIPDPDYVCPSLVAYAGVVFAIGGRSNTALAVTAGGRGDVTETHVRWTVKKGSNVSSPAYFEGHLYWVHESAGTLNCLDAATGRTVFEERIQPRPNIVFASLVVADGKLFAVSQHNGTFVFAARPQYSLLAHNVFADDDSRTNASLAIDGSDVFLRNDKHVYCIRK
jgi:outer membrane protein assembly factor BamB